MTKVVRLVVARPRRCCIPTCSRPTCRGSRRSPTRSRRASGRSRCSAPCRSRARRSSASASASAGSSSSSASSCRRSSSARATRRIPNQPAYARPVELDHPVDRLRAALPLLRPAARHRPALRLRRRLVRAADLPRERARHLVPAAHGRRDDARAAVDRAVAARAGGRVDGAVAPADRNAAWTPPAAVERRPQPRRRIARSGLDARGEDGVAGARRRRPGSCCVVGGRSRTRPCGTLPITREPRPTPRARASSQRAA